MRVSVIIPAHNAAETLGSTLESLLAQTHAAWEAIIVDDGSTDHTAAVAAEFVARDARIRLVTQKQSGESAARNHGIRISTGESLLFLDSDDWIKPPHLSRLTAALAAEPRLDAVYCGWGYVLPDGEWVFEEVPTLAGDVFEAFAQYCLSVVHTFVVRRRAVDNVGAFDASLRTCPDWDLWQRIARMGARFGVVPEVLAAYRIRANSASRNGRRLFADGRQVLARGHGEDPRLGALSPHHARGLSPRTRPRAEYELACACAGYEIGGGREAQGLFDDFHGERWPDLDPFDAGACLFRHAMIATGRPRNEWLSFWNSLHDGATRFLKLMEERSGATRLAPRALRTGDRLAVMYTPGEDPGLRLRRWHASLMLNASKATRARARHLREAARRHAGAVSFTARTVIRSWYKGSW
jgi:glycosyltransferase involved in cell wall biosynthesis